MGMESAAELSDLVHEDLRKLYPDLVPKVKIEWLDVAPKALGMFYDKLGKYSMETFEKQRAVIKTNYHIEELRVGLPRISAAEDKGNETRISDLVMYIKSSSIK